TKPLRVTVAASAFALGAGLMATIAPQTAFAAAPACSNDAKLLNGGPTQVFGDGPGTYWNIIEGGLQAAFGDDDKAKVQYLSGVFGQSFATLDEARAYNLQALSDAFDANGDGLVCVYDQRGRRAGLQDPFSQYTYFGVDDDRVGKGHK